MKTNRIQVLEMMYWENLGGGKDLGDKTSIQRPDLVDRVRLRNKAGA